MPSSLPRLPISICLFDCLLVCPFRPICAIKQGIHRHQTPPWYRNAASGSRLKVQPSTHRHTAHYGQSSPNVTSSIKPEVHNASQRRPRRTEPRLQGSGQKDSCRSVQRFQRYDRGQTDRQTNWSQYSAPLQGWSNKNDRLPLYKFYITLR